MSGWGLATREGFSEKATCQPRGGRGPLCNDREGTGAEVLGREWAWGDGRQKGTGGRSE